MSATEPAKAFLIFTGSGPILLLCTYPSVTDDRLVEKLRYKGIDRFLAYEVDLEAVRKRYLQTFEGVVADLGDHVLRSGGKRMRPALLLLAAELCGYAEDIRVLDFNGHQIMANFSLEELGEPVKYSG